MPDEPTAQDATWTRLNRSRQHDEYLTSVLDLFSRRAVRWEILTSLATLLVLSTLRKAIPLRRPDTKQLLIDSDRGCQSTSDCSQKLLETMSIICSMQLYCKGCCYDNDVVELFLVFET